MIEKSDMLGIAQVLVISSKSCADWLRSFVLAVAIYMVLGAAGEVDQ